MKIQNHQIIRTHSPPMIKKPYISRQKFMQMKKIIFYLLAFFPGITVIGQFKNGDKVWTSAISNFSVSISKSETTSNSNPPQTSKVNDFRLNPEITFGKIKNNQLFSYGLSLIAGITTQEGGSNRHTLGIAPVIIYQKIYPLSEKLFFTPITRLNVGYQYSKQEASSFSSAQIQKSIVGSLGFYPFSLTFLKNEKTSFIFTITRISIDYNRTKSYLDPQIANGKTISSNLLFAGSLNSVGFGIQKHF